MPMLEKNKKDKKYWIKKQDAMLLKVKNSLLNGGKKESLLLHACCAPCSSYVLELLSPLFNITIFYYNPNIYPPLEYKRRLTELKEFLVLFPPAVKEKVSLIEGNYSEDTFYSAIDIEHNPKYITQKERGPRCRSCYYFRLKEAYLEAKKRGFTYFCSTLSISPYKDATLINECGEEISKEVIPNNKDASTNDSKRSTPIYLYNDFKCHNGYKRSIELSHQYGLYRQDYCGCVYSKNKNP